MLTAQKRGTKTINISGHAILLLSPVDRVPLISTLWNVTALKMYTKNKFITKIKVNQSQKCHSDICSNQGCIDRKKEACQLLG
jgi:hypothetical protein